MMRVLSRFLTMKLYLPVNVSEDRIGGYAENAYGNFLRRISAVESKKKRKYKSKYIIDANIQVQKNKEYRITKQDEKIIRRYVLILQDTAPRDYLIEVMANVFRTTIEDVIRILDATSSKEMSGIALVRERWRKGNSKARGGVFHGRMIV